MTELFRLFAGAALLASGLLGVVVGGGAYLQAWYAGWAYARSGEAERSERLANQLQTPLWIEASDEANPGAEEPSVLRPTVESESGLPAANRPPGESSSSQPSFGSPASGGDPADEASPAAEAVATPQPRATAAEVELAAVDFRFLDPPEAGAHARLAIELHNRAEAPTGPLSLVIPARWFESYQVIGAAPSVLDDRSTPEGARYFDFPGLDPGATATFELHVTAAEDDVSPPEVRLTLGAGDEVGQAQPRTVAPRPRPGPASTISIPRLGIQARVVQTAWEPPSFVVGQIRGTANLSEGNTVLIGHIGGLAGNVFAPLDRIRPGDEVVAVSRGLDYHFVVSETTILPNLDRGPMLKTDTPRLTLMTCVGTWNPITQDYSHRLWVVAEPPDLAEKTIAANAERDRLAAQATATAAAAETAAAAVPTAQPTADPSAVPAPASAAPIEAPLVTSAAEIPPTSRTEIPPSAVQKSQQPASPSAGLRLLAPAPESRVPRRFVLKGTRATPIDPSLHIWLFVRADVEGSYWYPYPKEIVARPDGTWQAELDLGGPANVRHELRLGVVSSSTRAALLRLIAEHPNAPLEELPRGFSEEIQFSLIRQ